MPVPPVEASVASAREAAEEALSGWAVDDATGYDALLIVSELLTNAIRHGAAPIELRVRLADDGVVINVSDCGTKRPVLREIEPTAPHGRGLHLVDARSPAGGAPAPPARANRSGARSPDDSTEHGHARAVRAARRCAQFSPPVGPAPAAWTSSSW